MALRTYTACYLRTHAEEHPMPKTALAPVTGYDADTALRHYRMWLAQPSDSLSGATQRLYDGAARAFDDFLASPRPWQLASRPTR